MTTPLRLAGVAALCAALLLTGCAKKTDQTTSSDTTTTQAAADAGATPAADAGASGDSTAAPDAGTPAPELSPSAAPTASSGSAGTTVTSGTTTATTGSGSNGAGSGGYITLPVYPGATASKEQSIAATTGTGSLSMQFYETKDDAKKVSDWYKAHLPASFKAAILTTNGKTIGTFVDEHPDGDQNIAVTSDMPPGTTRIQLTTKHGK
ncbi:MAG TPA: hypothetical protein VK669_06995 [Candidatus Limnocylindrales bacterium]|nr:hypothetical protein [Candidatus Limnocylindrales bacterium]